MSSIFFISCHRWSGNRNSERDENKSSYQESKNPPLESASPYQKSRNLYKESKSPYQVSARLYQENKKLY